MINLKSFFFTISLIWLFSMNVAFAQKINQFNNKNERIGVWKKYYDNKSIRYEGQFKDGKEIGIFKFYDKYNNRFPSITKQYFNTSDSILVSFFSAKGNLQSKGYYINKNRVGEWVYFFENGAILSKENYKNGRLHGKVINYYPNGKETEITQYVEGKKNGLSKTFTSEGVLLESLFYENNKLNGLAKYYDLQGNLKEKGNYKDGKRVGKWEYYIDGEAIDKKDIEAKKRYKKND